MNLENTARSSVREVYKRKMNEQDSVRWAVDNTFQGVLDRQFNENRQTEIEQNGTHIRSPVLVNRLFRWFNIRIITLH